MNRIRNTILSLAIILVASSKMLAQPVDKGFAATGSWNLTISIEDEQMQNLGLFRHGLMNEDGFPGWLQIKKSGFSTLVGYYVGYEGSKRPISKIHYSAKDKTYRFTIPPQWMDIGDIEFEFTLANGKLSGYKILDGNKLSWTGVRAPKLQRKTPPIWGTPINLLDDNLSRWIIPDNNQWHMQDGFLINPKKGGNLVTKETFNDFKISAEFRIPERSNSGIYLRGRYELQILDGYGKEVSDQSVGGIYGFIAPSENAAKQAGEWQTYEITLVGRYVTVVYNGVEVIYNRPIPGITGGALSGAEGEPGPLMLQGDHGLIEYRKLVVTPAVKQ